MGNNAQIQIAGVKDLSFALFSSLNERRNGAGGNSPAPELLQTPRGGDSGGLILPSLNRRQDSTAPSTGARHFSPATQGSTVPFVK